MTGSEARHHDDSERGLKSSDRDPHDGMLQRTSERHTYFKEGVDVMLTRLQEYRDRRKQRIEKVVEEKVEKVVEKVRKEAYKAGYEAAKAESRSQQNKSS